MEYAIAVIDIGMTNKKVAVYDQNLKQLDAAYKNFEPMQIPHPVTGEKLDTHDLQGMKEWFFATLKDFAGKYPIKAISVTTHGATFVCLDKAGRECAPCIFYTYEPGPDFQSEFYQTVGSADQLQQEIFTPPFSSMINPAKGIFFLQKYFPESFQHTDCILNYPQYWGYILTGNKGVEPTYVSNHSYLWNHKEETYSQATERLNIRHLLPDNYKNTHEVLGNLTSSVAQQLGLPESTIVTMGIHDSNASLLPYLAKDSHGDFILNSTGTWCVSMHPQKELLLNPEDVGKIVYFTQTALRTPVKIAIFLGGMEFDTYLTLYKEIAGTDQFPAYNPEIFQEVLQDKDTFLLPEVVPGSGQYTSSQAGILEKGKFYSLEEIKARKAIPELFKNPEKLLAVLDISLVIQTITALQRAGMQDGTNIFTEGGFRKNKGYNQLLASVLQQHSVQLTNMEEATAFGAAMTGVMAYTGKSHKDLADTITIEYTDVEKIQFHDFDAYQNQWIKLATKKETKMKTKAVRIHGVNDLRLDEFELPAIKEDEILARIVSDSICMSSHKLAMQGDAHKRVRSPLKETPIIIGHEFCGELVEVGSKWQHKFKAGEKFAIQPALNYQGTLWAPGYSYQHIGGDATYVVIPNEVMEMDCLLEYKADNFFMGSLAEPISCVVGAFHAQYHTKNGSYVHEMGIVEGGSLALLAGVGPMGLGAIDYAIHCDRKPGLMVVTDIDEGRLQRAASIFTVEEAAKNGVKLFYVNTKDIPDPVAYLKEMNGGKLYDDVFVFAPVAPVVEMADSLLGNDGCMNFFAGPTNTEFSAKMNFYNVHYESHHIVGTSGGNTDDLKESLKMMAESKLNPVALVTHVGGLNAVADTTINLDKIPGGKKLIYTNKKLDLVAINDFEEKGKSDPFYAKLYEIIAKNNMLWCKEAEDYLLANAPEI